MNHGTTMQWEHRHTMSVWELPFPHLPSDIVSLPFQGEYTGVFVSAGFSVKRPELDPILSHDCTLHEFSGCLGLHDLFPTVDQLHMRFKPEMVTRNAKGKPDLT